MMNTSGEADNLRSNSLYFRDIISTSSHNFRYNTSSNSSEVPYNTTPLIHKQWQHSLEDPANRAFFIFCCITLTVFCICGNLLVLIVMLRTSRMRTRTNLFLANLAVADLSVGIFCIMPFMWRQLHATWELGQVLCKLNKFTETLSVTASMILLEVIAVERYIAIVHPLKIRRIFTQRNMNIVQVLSWLAACVYSFPLVFVYDTLDWGGIVFCHYRKGNLHVLNIYRILNGLLWYAMPLVVVACLYFRIFLRLRSSHVTHQVLALRKRSRRAPGGDADAKQTTNGLNGPQSSNDVKAERGSIISTVTLRWRTRKLGRATWRKSARDDGFGCDCCDKPRQRDDGFGCNSCDKPARDDGFGCDCCDKPARDDGFGCDCCDKPRQRDNTIYKPTREESSRSLTSDQHCSSQAGTAPGDVPRTILYRSEFRRRQSGCGGSGRTGASAHASTLYSSSSDSTSCASLEESHHAGHVMRMPAERVRYTLLSRAPLSTEDYLTCNADSLQPGVSANESKRHFSSGLHNNHSSNAPSLAEEVDSFLPTNQDSKTSQAPAQTVSHSHSNNSSSPLHHYRATTKNSSRQRVVRLLVVVLCAFAILLFPLKMLHILIVFKVHLNDVLTKASYILLYLNSTLNPFLYSLMSQTFRRSLREAVSSWKPKRQTRLIRQYQVHNRPDNTQEAHTRHPACRETDISGVSLDIGGEAGR